MTLLDGKLQETNLLRRLTDSVTPLRLLLGLGITFIVSVFCFVGLCFVGMAYFTAKESDIPWFWPAMQLTSALCFLSGFGLALVLIVAAVQKIRRD